LRRVLMVLKIALVLVIITPMRYQMYCVRLQTIRTSVVES